MDFSDNISSQQVEADIAEIDRGIKQKYPEMKRIFIEAEKRGNRFRHHS